MDFLVDRRRLGAAGFEGFQSILGTVLCEQPAGRFRGEQHADPEKQRRQCLDRQRHTPLRSVGVDKVESHADSRRGDVPEVDHHAVHSARSRSDTSGPEPAERPYRTISTVVHHSFPPSLEGTIGQGLPTQNPVTTLGMMNMAMCTDPACRPLPTKASSAPNRMPYLRPQTSAIRR